MGEKAHLRTMAAVLANATATTLVYPSVQGPAWARRQREPAGRRRPAGFIHHAADTYVDQLQSCRPEILYPQLVDDTPNTEILKKIYCVKYTEYEIGPLLLWNVNRKS